MTCPHLRSLWVSSDSHCCSFTMVCTVRFSVEYGKKCWISKCQSIDLEAKLPFPKVNMLKGVWRYTDYRKWARACWLRLYAKVVWCTCHEFYGNFAYPLKLCVHYCTFTLNVAWQTSESWNKMMDEWKHLLIWAIFRFHWANWIHDPESAGHCQRFEANQQKGRRLWSLTRLRL